jgi:hypothetical protein
MELVKKKKRCAPVLVADVFWCLIQHKPLLGYSKQQDY